MQPNQPYQDKSWGRDLGAQVAGRFMTEVSAVYQPDEVPAQPVMSVQPVAPVAAQPRFDVHSELRMAMQQVFN